MKTKQFVEKVYNKDIDHFYILDTETTGIDLYYDGITQVGVLEVKGMKVINTFESLYNPGVEISEFITDLTGISYDDVKDKPSISEDKTFFDFMNKDIPVIAHNFAFDKNILINNGAELKDKKWIDSIYMFKIFFPGMDNYKLDTIIDNFGRESPYFNKRHNALSDVYNLAHVLFKGFKGIENIEDTLSVPFSSYQPIFKTGDYKKEYGVNEEHVRESLEGLVICFTGSLVVKREAMVKLIEDNGATYSKGVTQKVDLLVVGEDAGKKLKKGEELGIKIVNEDEFTNMIN